MAKASAKRLPRGAKKLAFFEELERRFPAGQFRFGEAVECYRDAERRLGVQSSRSSAVNVRDLLWNEGAFFAEHTRPGGCWPRTSKANLVTLPCHPDHARLVLEDRRGKLLERLAIPPSQFYPDPDVRREKEAELDEVERQLAELR